MTRTDSLKPIVAALTSIAFSLILSTNALSHSGHKHDALPITIPDVVAQVNGQEIEKKAIEQELKRIVKKYKNRGKTLTKVQIKNTAQQLIQDEIGRTVVLQKGKELGINVNAKSLDEKIAQVKSRYKSEAVFEHKLKNRGMTIEQYREELRIDLLMEEVIKKEVSPGIKVDSKEMESYFEKNKSQFQTAEKRRASVILIKVYPKLGAAREQKSRNKMLSVHKQALEGKGFDSLAQRFSQDSLAAKGGDLGYFEKDQMMSAFSKRAFNLKVGEISEVFKTKHGYHILKLTDIQAAKTSSFEDEKENIRSILAKTKIDNATKKYIESLKNQAKIKTYF
jgi:parvulin-like peptidyl-prolyl isomerase